MTNHAKCTGAAIEAHYRLPAGLLPTVEKIPREITDSLSVIRRNQFASIRIFERGHPRIRIAPARDVASG